MKIEELRLLKDDIIKHYQEGLSIAAIGRLYTSRKSSIRTILTENDIRITSAVKNRQMNHEYFSRIDTANKAYFVGFLFADGSVYWRRRETVKRGTVQIEVANKDVDIIDKFLVEINANYNIHKGVKSTSSIKITSDQLVKDLEKHNVIPNKTYLAKELSKKIPPVFEVDYLRGLIDGDGSIYLDDRGNKKLSFATVSKEISKEFQKRVDRLIQKTVHTKINHQKNLYTVTWSGRIQVQKILDILYYPSSLSLDRKQHIACSKI